MNDKNKDVLKLLKSWGIYDKYVHSVSIKVSAEKRIPEVNIEYKLPPRNDSKEEQKEYKPKFKLGEEVRVDRPLLKGVRFYVQQICTNAGARSSTDVYYVLEAKETNLYNILRLREDELLACNGNGKANKYPLMLIQDISDWPHPPRYSVVAIVGNADGHQIGQVVYSAKTEQKAISAKLDFEEGRRTLFNIADMRDD